MPSSAARARSRRPVAGTTKAPTARTSGDTTGRAPDLALVDLIALAENAVGALEDVFAALDASILREFAAIAGSIARAKEDIARLEPHYLSQRRIPDAGRELAAVVDATEDATHRIMAASERMLEAEVEDVDAYRDLVKRQVTKIFEACSFQDITGQRVGKVVETLEEIDERVGHIARALGTHETAPAPQDRESERELRKKKLMLNGPALDGEGVGQDDVDQLLDSDLPEDVQQSIDRHFD